METIRILLVDDHEVVRTGLRSFLEAQDYFEVVGEACNGDEAIDLAMEIQPDVTVMDITMPGMDGLESTRRLAKKCPDCDVLALTVHDDKQYFFEMMAAGAAGYISKQAAADELVDAIRTVCAGDVYLQPSLANWLLDDYRRLLAQTPTAEQSPPHAESEQKQELHPDLDVLSERELQVLEMVAEGLTTPQIAEKLGLSPKTISRHRGRIMNKLDIHSATKLVKFAIRVGLITV
ncbi:MAG: Transcriptional regulatory protein DegU [Chloroflexi bacterium]|nr:Transcriptional regulatory protein DegU [Chloroflexota bacterium]